MAVEWKRSNISMHDFTLERSLIPLPLLGACIPLFFVIIIYISSSLSRKKREALGGEPLAGNNSNKARYPLRSRGRRPDQ